MHEVVISPSRSHFVDKCSAHDAPPTVGLFSLAVSSDEASRGVSALATFVRCLFARTFSEEDLSFLRRPSLTSFTPRDGGPELHCSILAPDPELHGPGPYPTVVYVYGGPHAQRVKNDWLLTANGRNQRLCAAGFLVFMCDNRGRYATCGLLLTWLKTCPCSSPVLVVAWHLKEPCTSEWAAWRCRTRWTGSVGWRARDCVAKAGSVSTDGATGVTCLLCA